MTKFKKTATFSIEIVKKPLLRLPALTHELGSPVSKVTDYGLSNQDFNPSTSRPIFHFRKPRQISRNHLRGQQSTQEYF